MKKRMNRYLERTKNWLNSWQFDFKFSMSLTISCTGFIFLTLILLNYSTHDFWGTYIFEWIIIALILGMASYLYFEFKDKKISLGIFIDIIVLVSLYYIDTILCVINGCEKFTLHSRLDLTASMLFITLITVSISFIIALCAPRPKMNKKKSWFWKIFICLCFITSPIIHTLSVSLVLLILFTFLEAIQKLLEDMQSHLDNIDNNSQCMMRLNEAREKINILALTFGFWKLGEKIVMFVCDSSMHIRRLFNLLIRWPMMTYTHDYYFINIVTMIYDYLINSLEILITFITVYKLVHFLYKRIIELIKNKLTYN